MQFKLIIGSYFSWKFYFAKYTAIKGIEMSWLGIYFQVVIK